MSRGRGTSSGTLRLAIGIGLLVAGVAHAQEPQYFEEPPARPKLSLSWDFLARYDQVDHWRGYEPVRRGRFELRPEVGFEPSETLRIAVRGVFDYGTDAESYPQYDNYESRGAALERYYILWRPGAFAVRAGRFGIPLVATEMLWDRDIQTPGAAAAWSSPDGAWTLAGAGFYAPQRDGERSRIAVGQVVWRSGDAARFQIEAAASYWSYDLRDLKPVYIRENTPRLADGRLEYASGFHVADLILRLRFPLAGLPVLVSLDGMNNFEAQTGRRLAFEGALVVGRLGTPGNWRAVYSYQYIQRDATVGAYNGDDWWWHTWYEGHRLALGVTVLPQVYVQGSAVVQRRLDLDFWINRYMVDLVKMF
ncbi:MAG: hypothetical protein WEB59_11385 [Thermoanaerobaculia bacterium]